MAIINPYDGLVAVAEGFFWTGLPRITSSTRDWVEKLGVLVTREPEDIHMVGGHQAVDLREDAGG